jgi:hypothetical protein
MSEQARALPEVMPDLGITMSDYQKLCLRAFENLPADTSVTIGDVDSVLTWCLPDFIRLRAAHAGDPAALGQHAESYALLHGHAGPCRREEMTEAFRAGYLAASAPGFKIPLIVDDRQPPGTVGLISAGTDADGKLKVSAVVAVNVAPDPKP